MKDVDQHRYQFSSSDSAGKPEDTMGSVTLACAVGFMAMAGVIGMILVV